MGVVVSHSGKKTMSLEIESSVTAGDKAGICVDLVFHERESVSG